MATVTFHPQAWINDYAVEVDPQGPTTWEVEDIDIAELKSDTYESDDLRYHPNAPKWVQDWCGPFYIEILYINS